jgi:hypothetical protein
VIALKRLSEWPRQSAMTTKRRLDVAVPRTPSTAPQRHYTICIEGGSGFARQQL